MLDTDEATAALLKNARDLDAGIAQLVAYNKDNEPLWCVIVATNPEQAADVLDAIKDIE